MTRRPLAFDELPLFASEYDLAVALLGAARSGAWRDIAPLYERRGLPKIDPLMEGRYVPAVKAFFDSEYRLAPQAPASPPGVERPISWNRAYPLAHTNAETY